MDPLFHTPGRSRQQRLEALARANEIRIQRSELKRGLRSGDERLEEIITDLRVPFSPRWRVAHVRAQSWAGEGGQYPEQSGEPAKNVMA